MKTLFITIAALSLLSLSSCIQCYNERFCNDMIGRNIDTAITLMGNPTSVQTNAGVTVYTWFTDQSYTSSYTRPAYEEHWRDDKGRKHAIYQPAEVVTNYNSQKAEITFMCQNGTIVNYNCNSDYNMCNVFVPQQIIQQYIAADEAAKAAQ